MRYQVRPAYRRSAHRRIGERIQHLINLGKWCVPVATALGIMACATVAQAQSGRLLTGGPSLWEGEVELGILLDSGNTDATTLKGLMYLQQERESWRNSIRLSARMREVDDRTTEERYHASSQADYKLNDTDYTFVRGRYDEDRFARLDYRVSAVSGYGQRVWQQGERYLDLSAGLGYSVTRFDAPTPNLDQEVNGVISRIALDLAYPISINALFRQQVSTEVSLSNSQNTSLSITSVQANVGRSFALKVSYIVERDSEVPQDTANTDTETSLTLLYAF